MKRPPVKIVRAEGKLIKLCSVKADPLDLHGPRRHRPPQALALPSHCPPVLSQSPSSTSIVTGVSTRRSAASRYWQVPRCVSNWKNPRGYTIPIEKRLEAPGASTLRPGQSTQVEISEKFLKMGIALELAERMLCSSRSAAAPRRTRALEDVEGEIESPDERAPGPSGLLSAAPGGAEDEDFMLYSTPFARKRT